MVRTKEDLNLIPKLLLVLGAAILIYGCSVLFRDNKSKWWPTTTGKVSKTFVSEEEMVTKYGKTTTIRANIHFEYEINGNIYLSQMGTAVSKGVVFPNRKEAESYLEKLPDGKLVKVYYDPNNPSFGILFPGSGSNMAYGSFIISFFILLLGYKDWQWN